MYTSDRSLIFVVRRKGKIMFNINRQPQTVKHLETVRPCAIMAQPAPVNENTEAGGTGM